MAHAKHSLAEVTIIEAGPAAALKLTQLEVGKHIAYLNTPIRWDGLNSFPP